MADAELQSLELKIKGNASGATKSLNTLINTLEKLEKATAGGCGLGAVSKEMSKIQNTSVGLSSANASSSLSFAKLATKVTATALALKKVGKTIASWINESNEYVENLNLFTVAMGEYAGSAKEYAETVGDIMGIDPSTWMRNQGVFMTMATGFGVAGDRAATMSQQLTQLGYDLSSFYNTSVEDAMQKLQSGLAGELEPLRRLGYDLSQAKLEATALSLGIDKTVSSMTQAEKAELRYYAIMTQVTQVQGDMARTLDNPANQLRILKAQVEQAARALGNIFIPALNAVLPYAIAAVKVFRILADAVASLMGFSLAEVDFTNTGEDTAEGFQEANEEIAKMKKMLLGIDELNVMSDTSSSSASSGGSFDFELPTYDFIGEATDNRVNEIVESMKEWLGISDDITSWADLMETKLGSLLTIAVSIGGAIAAWKIWSTGSAIVGLLKGTGIVKFISNIGSAISAVAAGTGTLGEAITLVFSGAAGIISGFAAAIAGIIGYVKNFISILRDGENVTNILGAALGGLATSAGGFLIAIGAGATLATGGIVAAVIAAVAGVGMLVAVIINHWDEIKAAIGTAWAWLYDNVLAPVGEWFAGVATWFYSNVISPIVDFFAPIVTMVVDMVVLIYTKIKEIVEGIIEAVGSILSKVGEIFVKIVEIAVALGEAFYTYVITPVFDFIASIATWVYENALKPIMEFFARIGGWLSDNIITPIVDSIVKLRDRLVKLLTGIGTAVVDFISETFKAVINGILATIERNINAFIRMLNGAIDLINEIPGVDITKVTELSIPRLAEGGTIENRGQLFVANEAGPELVSSIGNKTAVMNNDQIVESVSRGVYKAVVQAMGQSGNQTVEAKVNDKVLFEVVVNRTRQETVRTGYNPLLGGV